MKLLSKALNISPLFVIPERGGFGEMAFQYHNPEEYQTPGLHVQHIFGSGIMLKHIREGHRALQARFKYTPCSEIRVM